MRHVLTKDTNARVALDKFSRQLDGERTGRELQFQHQKQQLQFLRNSKSHKKEKNDHGTCDKTWQKPLNLKIAPDKSPNRCRSYSEQDVPSVGLRDLKLKICCQRYKADECKEAANVYLLARESLGSEIDVNHVVLDKPRESLQSDRCGEIKNEVHTEHTTNSDITETKFKRPRALSDLLPPIFLPPIYQRCMAKLLQRGKVHERQRARAGNDSGCERTGTYQTAVGAWFEDLKE